MTTTKITAGSTKPLAGSVLVSTYAAFTDTLSPGNRGSSRDGTRYGSPRTVELGQGVSGPAIVLRPALPSGVGSRG